MSGQGHNVPPIVTLDLDEVELKYLHELLELSNKNATDLFKELCSMPSSDPRAKARSMLTMGATADKVMSGHLLDRINVQIGDTS